MTHQALDTPQPHAVREERRAADAMWRGMRGRCPACGERGMFRAFLKVADECPSCGTELHHQRADDMPPYVVMFITGHLIIYLLLVVERAYSPEVWVHMALWIPATIVLSLALLTPVKGALVGLQWALRMHGFGHSEKDEAAAHDGGIRP